MIVGLPKASTNNFSLSLVQFYELYWDAEEDEKLIVELLFFTISALKFKRNRLIFSLWDKRPGEKILDQKLLESLLCIMYILLLLFLLFLWCNYSKTTDSWVPIHHHWQLDTCEWRWRMVRSDDAVVIIIILTILHSFRYVNKQFALLSSF